MLKIAIALLLVIGGSLSWAEGTTYKWRDEKGVWNFSNLPPSEDCRSADCVKIRAGVKVEKVTAPAADDTAIAPGVTVLEEVTDDVRYQDTVEDWYLKAYADVRERAKRFGDPRRGSRWLYAPSDIQCQHGGALEMAIKYVEDRQGLTPNPEETARILDGVDPFWDTRVCDG